MRRTLIALAAMLALAGCGTGATSLEVRQVTLTDGRTVDCVLTASVGGDVGRLDCDFGEGER